MIDEVDFFLYIGIDEVDQIEEINNLLKTNWQGHG